MPSLTIKHQLERLAAAMRRYIVLSGRALDDVLERYGRDLGIKLFQGFSAHRWGGDVRGRGLAIRELEGRTASHRGTLVRASILADYQSARGALLAENKALRSASGPLTRGAARANERARNRNARQRITLWQRAVGREIGARAAGRGVLAASFLWYRKRQSRDRGTFFVVNRTGHPLGSVEKTENALVIRGFTEGLDVIDARYGIVSDAIESRLTDTETHLRESYLGIAQEAGLGAA